jgi:hypothetical protein
MVVVCGPRPRRKRCGVCGRPADKLCDWPMPAGGTCDLPICDRCAVPIGKDKDLCPGHDFVREREVA